MIEIDGSKGEGGGQIVRSSLALSAITGKPFTILNVRAGRKKPGLKRQHVMCVKAAAQICDATVEGARLESDFLTFFPGELKSGEYHFSISTAGSACLVAQTVLPALMVASGPSKILVEGGTHNPMAPCFDFLERVYLPQVEKMGPGFKTSLLSCGFYPAGGGKFEIDVTPVAELTGLELSHDFGKFEPKVHAIVSGLPEHIGEREVDTVRRKMNWSPKSTKVIRAQNPKGLGNALLIELVGKESTEMVFGLGERGKPAEKVAADTVKLAKKFLAYDVPVGEHLADQLMLPTALAARHGPQSRFLTVPLTQHSLTHKTIVERFLDVKIDFAEKEKGVVEVIVGPPENF